MFTIFYSLSPQVNNSMAWVKLTEEQKTSFKYIPIAHHIIPHALGKALDWGCRKNNNETYWSLVVKKTNGRERNNMFYPEQKNLLQNNTSHSTFDATLLFSLIKVACEDIKHHNHDDWKDESTMEGSIVKLKDVRNSICHEFTLPNITIDEVEELCKKVIDLIGGRYGVDNTIVLNTKKEVENLFNKRVHNFFTKELFEQIERFRMESANETKKRWEIAYGADRLKPKESSKLHVKIDEADVEVAWNEIFKKLGDGDSLQSLVMLIGPPGSGKTTFTSFVGGKHFEDGNCFDEKGQMDLIFFFSCRDTEVKSIYEMMESNYPKSCDGLSEEDAMNVLKSARVCILIDAYDEASADTKKVVKQILKITRNLNSYSLVITLRPHKEAELKELIEKNKIIHRICKIGLLNTNEKQRDFLRHYEDSIDDLKGVVDSFVSVTKKVKTGNFFETPIKCVHFTFLFLHQREKLEAIANISDFNLLSYDWKKQCIVQKISEVVNVNEGITAQNIIEVFEDLAMEKLMNDSLILNEIDYDEIQKEVSKILPYSFDVEIITSTLLTLKTSPTNFNRKTLEWAHKTDQEAAGAKCLIRKMSEEKKKKPLRNLIGDALEIKVTDDHESR